MTMFIISFASIILGLALMWVVDEKMFNHPLEYPVGFLSAWLILGGVIGFVLTLIFMIASC